MTSKKNNNTLNTLGESSQEPQAPGLRRPSSSPSASTAPTRAELRRRALWPQVATQAEREEFIRRRRAGASAADSITAAGSTAESDAGMAGSGRRGDVDERRTAPDVDTQAKRGGGR